MSWAYYNEIDPFAAAWLRQLMDAGLIAPGEVDERSIEDVLPSDLKGYTQCHFFAGIGVWSYALRRAGWNDDSPVWTGSCPCQPFSAAGKGGGFADERHLWPAFFHLIGAERPGTVLGEQVASKDGLAWLDLVQTDMEAEDYAFGAIDTCAAGFGAPHIRQRLYWMAHTMSAGRPERGAITGNGQVAERGSIGGVAITNGWQRSGFTNGERCERDGATAGWFESYSKSERGGEIVRPSPTNGFWRSADWLYCRDAKWRPVEPETFPLAHGAPARVGRLRGYGNAINAAQAQGFIEAVMEVI